MKCEIHKFEVFKDNINILVDCTSTMACVNVQLIFCRWEKTHALLIEGGLTYNAIQNSVAEATIAFRDGVTELFELLEVQYSHYQLLFSETS